MVINKKVACRRCGGEGFVGMPTTPSMVRPLGWQCPVCHGSGRAPK